MKKKKNIFNFFGIKDKYARRRTLFVIGFLIFFIIIRVIIGIIEKPKQPQEISFLLENKLVSLKHEMFLDDKGVIYLSKEDIENEFDKTLYYNDAEKELITTCNKHIALLKIDEDFMVVNDSNVELKSPMIEKNKVVYVPISEMGIVYDLEFEYSENNKRVIADSILKEKNRALVINNVKLKNSKGIFSKKTEKIERGKYVTIIEKEKKYYKVRSEAGNIGYIKQSKLSDLEKIRDSLFEEEVDVNILKSASDITKKYSNTKIDDKKTNVVIPTFFYIDFGSTGVQILDKTNSSTDDYKNYMSWVKENNIKVWSTLSINSEVSNSLRTYSDRNKIINDLYYRLVEYEFQGVNIKFDKIDDVNSFNRFVIEITPRLKELGIKVCVTSNKNVDKEKLKDIVDYIIE